MTPSELVYLKKLPPHKSFDQNSILIYDSYLIKQSTLKTWISDFPYKIGVHAGEKLKSLESFKMVFLELLEIVEKVQSKEITLIALGGGSVGDFVGFMASVFKRGVDLVHIPSTWLSAIDSAHGGKTALNIDSYKNQIGTFYPARKIFIIESILSTQPPERLNESLGEVIKTVLLSGGVLWRKFSRLKKIDNTTLWKALPDLIAYKYKIVKKDPYEKKGLRYFLNFGHTIGHILESYHKIPHGVAVNHGIVLALEFSHFKKILSSKHYYEIKNSLFLNENLISRNLTIERIKKMKNRRELLIQDKKSAATGQLKFVFLKKVGIPIVESVSFDEIENFLTYFTEN